MGKADLHTHTHFSDGFATPEGIVHAAERRGLDLLAVTDHDSVEGALRAQRIAEGRRLEVVVGVEVTTRSGHLIGLGVGRAVKPFRSFEFTAEALYDAGASLIVVPHPFAWWIKGASPRAIRQLARIARPGTLALELSVAPGTARFDRRIHSLAAELGLPLVSGSDTHGYGVGEGATWYPGSSFADLTTAVASQQLTVDREPPVWRDRLRDLPPLFRRAIYAGPRQRYATLWRLMRTPEHAHHRSFLEPTA